MDDKTLPDLLSQLIPDDLEKALGLDEPDTDEQNNILVASLKAAAGQSGGLVETAVNEFLNGEGELLDTTRSAVTRGRSSAVSEIAAFLTTKFKLAPFTAKMVAMLLVKLFPSIGKLTAAGATQKKKPRRKKKTTSSSAKKPAASSKKKPKKTTTTTKKKKAPAKGSKKTTAAKKKTSKKTRSEPVDISSSAPE